MSKLTNLKLRRMIMQELAIMVDEDALVSKSADSHITGVDNYSYPIGEKETCSECGFVMMSEDECPSCGYRMTGILEEDCGCGCNGAPGGCGSDDGTDYSIDTMHGLGATSLHIDFPDHTGVKKYGHNNYMAKPSLFKVAKYAQKLFEMIPDGYELDDWQRTKIAQISDDISEVYHSLDYDFQGEEY